MLCSAGTFRNFDAHYLRRIAQDCAIVSNTYFQETDCIVHFVERLWSACNIMRSVLIFLISVLLFFDSSLCSIIQLARCKCIKFFVSK